MIPPFFGYFYIFKGEGLLPELPASEFHDAIHFTERKLNRLQSSKKGEIMKFEAGDRVKFLNEKAAEL
jgi:hypothetical protein